jgi:hypothetical protein
MMAIFGAVFLPVGVSLYDRGSLAEMASKRKELEHDKNPNLERVCEIDR